MGGSSGSYDPGQVRIEVRKLEETIESAAYQASIAQLLTFVLASANDRDVDQIQAHLSTIEEAIGKDVEGFVELLFGGSVAKHTYVSGLSDVDALVIVNNSQLSTGSPLEVRDHIIARLVERLPNTIVEADGFAVAVRYSDGVVELVPAQRHGDDYLLPNADCSAWSRTRSRAFTEALSASNRKLNGKLIPTIKLAKVALTEMPEARRPRGYHLEALAIEAFSEYSGPNTAKDMLPHFFAHAAQRILEPIADRTGQSRNVDDYLGGARSLERQILSDSIGRIARRLQNAEGAHSVDQWKRVFGEE